MPNTTRKFRKQILGAQSSGALKHASFAVATFADTGELLAVNSAAADLFSTVIDSPVLSNSWQNILEPLVSEMTERVSPSLERRVDTGDGKEMVVAAWRHEKTIQLALRPSTFTPHRAGFKDAIMDVLSTTGEEYFRNLVRACSEYLDMPMVALGMLSDAGNEAQPIAVYEHGCFLETKTEVSLVGLPSQDVKDKGFTLYRDNIRQHFPDSKLLKRLNAVSYIGLPVRNRTGDAIAQLSMIGDKPLSDDHIYRPTLLLIADRTAAEIERNTQISSLLKENSELAALFGNITDGVFINDAKGRLLDANSASLQMFGYDLDHFRTLSVKDLIDPSDLAIQPANLEPVLSGENLIYQRRFIGRDSKVFMCEVNIKQLPDGRIATICRSLNNRTQDISRLERSHERFRGVVESNMLGIYFWNLDGQISDANDRFLKLLGYSRQALARGDLNWKRLTPREWHKIDDVNMRLIRRDGKIEPFEKQLIHSEGHILPVMVGASVFEGTNEGVGFVLDLSEIKATENALSEGHSSLTRLVDNLPGVVFRAQIAPDWPLSYVCESIKGWTGFSADEFISQRRFIGDVIHPDDVHQVWEARQKALDQQHQFQISYRFVHINMEETWVWEQSRPVFNQDGKLVAFEGFIADNSERRQLDDQLQQARRLESIGRLAGGVAHDFNNLLTGVLGYSDFALMYTQDSKMREYLESIRSAAQRGAALTRQLLGFARKQIVEPQVFSPNTRIKDIRKLLHRLIGEDIELVLELNPESGMIKIDPSQFEQVLVNLVVNARDAMRSGGLLKLRSAPVNLGDSFVRDHPEVRKGKYVRIDIEDTGHGINTDALEKIFEPFFTTKEEGKGTGLGLATCYGIIKQNQGHIEVSSAPGHGALFTVYLPRIHAEA